MTATPITATMLGMSGSGKSTYLLGMYATLSKGIRNFFVHTPDLDLDTDLTDAWELLGDTGELPPPNSEDQYLRYEFEFTRGFMPLARLDWLDYRGGALRSKADDHADTRFLLARLLESDTVYLTLDGGKFRAWLDGGTGIVRDLRRMTVLVQRAVAQRREQGLPVPSLVLLITKCDLVADPGEIAPILLEVAKNGRLRDLVPVAFQEGVTAMLCPVQLGAFGSAGAERVDPATIDPFGLHRPLLFSLLLYLMEGIDAHQAELERIRRERGEAESELIGLRNGFLGGFFNRRRIVDVGHGTDRLRNQENDLGDTIGAVGERIRQIEEELRGHPILRDGELSL
jgi:hypothetical protein